MTASTKAAAGELVADLYRHYAGDPLSVDPSFGAVFDGLEGAQLTAAARAETEKLDPFRTALVLGRVIEAYRWRGHHNARLDPLGLAKPNLDGETTLERLLLQLADQHLQMPLEGALGLRKGAVPEILERLESIYCRSVGFEFMHVRDPVAREWLRHAIETGEGAPDLGSRRDAAQRLIEADEFEAFMQRRFVGKKRFGAEGAESIICALWAVITQAARLGVRRVVMAGTSRARLNQLATVVGKPLEAIFAEVKGASSIPPGVLASGDVAYHQGYVKTRRIGGADVTVEYCANPSHLETVDGVAAGRLRAIQDGLADGRRAALGLLVHTDAAFAAQGIVAEVAQLSRLPNYHTGGTIHVVINNQLGFTTEPEQGRSSAYCSDLGRVAGSPVFHVNGDDVDAVLRVATLAAEYRQRFGGDAIVDLVCYRRRGHNEMDEPSFTQPHMYARIAVQPPTRRVYLDLLAADGAVSAAEERGWTLAAQERLGAAYEAAAKWRPEPVATGEEGRKAATGVDTAELARLGRAISTASAGFALHPKIARVFGGRIEALESGEGINWAFAEGLALAALQRDGVAIRMSGQDTPRGAFSQRHFAIVDQESGRSASPFAALRGAPAEIFGSPLSEYATLGFEYGYSLGNERTLVIWEAQFGDFANVAQPVFDQFIAAGEDKWLQRSGLVVLLPHGLEGQGSEHSSARIERFLQLCARDNMVLANCTTPANYFHLLRAQGHTRRRPLIVFTPKSLLRHRLAVSALAEFGPAASFRPVIGPAPGPHRRLVLCSGKLFWELEAERRRSGREDVGLVRIERLYPFPARELQDVLAAAPSAELVWCQEEPQNMGAWEFLERRLEQVLRKAGSGAHWPKCVSRPANPSPAIGTAQQHEADQQALIRAALGVVA